jgi:hypothetical protein
MWFDFSLRLAYPGSGVAGMYFFDDFSGAQGNNMRLEDGKWVWDRTGMPPEVREIEPSNTLLIDYDPERSHGEVLERPPLEMAFAGELLRLENPKATVIGETPSPRALRRYRPCRDWLFENRH